MTRVITLLTTIALLWGSGAAPATAAHATESPVRTFLRAYLQQQGEADLGPVRAAVARVPIRANREEILAYLWGGSECGSGGCTLLVLDRRGSSYAVVTNIAISRPPVRVLPTWHHGRPDLAVFVAGGGIINGYEAVLPFNGTTYADNPSVSPAHPLHGAPGRIVIAPDQPGVPLL